MKQLAGVTALCAVMFVVSPARGQNNYVVPAPAGSEYLYTVPPVPYQQIVRPDELADYTVIAPDPPQSTRGDPGCVSLFFGTCADILGGQLDILGRENAYVHNPGQIFNYSGTYGRGYAGEYKGITIHSSGASFYYIRYDHLMRLVGGIQRIGAIVSYGTFGPFPTESTVKVRKGASYFFLLACSVGYRYIQLPISEDPLGQESALPCP